MSAISDLITARDARIAELERQLAEATKRHEDHLVRLSRSLGGLSRYINEQGDYRSLEDWEAFLLDRTQQLLHREADERHRAGHLAEEVTRLREALDALPFSQRDIKRGLILFRTSNNAHDYTNFVSLTAKVDALPQVAKDELADLMRNMAESLSPERAAQPQEKAE